MIVVWCDICIGWLVGWVGDKQQVTRELVVVAAAVMRHAVSLIRTISTWLDRRLCFMTVGV